MNTLIKLLGTCVVLLGSLQALAADSIASLQQDWARIKYEMPEKAQTPALKQLVDRAEQYGADHAGEAAALIWEGIIRATYAGADGGLSALGQAKKARALFERAIELDGHALHGSAYTSLGSLYYQVPGWPVGFGNDKKAREMLQKGLLENPDGIDSNYFFGDFLLQQGEYDAAIMALEKALKAPDRPDRALADQGRRAEIRGALDRARNRQKS
ncbi:MAG: hypothetical protein H6978_12540 [Gammaproteobacteria bacterium]|nr:hypothetical protein [Gammaproteobacteria bacterium]